MRILGVYIEDRTKEAGQVQEVLTKHGCNIKTRLGLHEVDENHCSTYGLVILELFGDEEGMNNLESALKAIEGVKIQKMVF
mgnify:CR=1 FL=1